MSANVEDLIARLGPEDLAALTDKLLNGRQPDSKMRKYWRNVRQKEQELRSAVDAGRLPGHTPKSGEVWLSSHERADDPDSKAGVVSSAAYWNSARALIDGSHQIATAQEIAAEQIRRQESGEEIEKKELGRTSRKQVIIMGHDQAREAGFPLPKTRKTKED